MKKIIALFVLFSFAAKAQITYPKTKKVDQYDIYFGTKVHDPYRWLENNENPFAQAWVEEQNKLTNSELDKITFRNKINQRLNELWNFAKQTAPFKKGDYLYYFKNNGLQNQAVLYRAKSLLESTSGKDQMVLDPNTLSTDGTTSLSGFAFSKDGKYMAYGISKSGSDWVEIHVRDMKTMTDLKDKIEWVKFSNIAWQGSGFYYSRYDAPNSEKTYTQSNTFHKVYYHKVGDEQKKDGLVYEDKLHAARNFSASLTDDERFLFISGSESTSGQSLMVKDLNADNPTWINVVDNFDNEYQILGNTGDDIFMVSDYKAPKRNIVKFNLANASQDKWITVIPEKENLLEGASFMHKKIICNYLKDASSKLLVYNLQGNDEKEIKLPGICTVNAVHSDLNEKWAYYEIVSYTAPSSVYALDGAVLTSKRIFAPNISFKSDEYETKQVFYTSKDGTKVPMFITHKKGITLNGNNPCFVFAYGGFNISYTPEFRIDRAVFLEAGGIYCVPNLRGGGEYGEEWHKAGTKCNKQNVFDDYIAACEYLVKEKYTSHDKLAIHGRSNGGLLIGATMTQRPDIAKVAIPTVGVLDMLRYQNFTIGRAWSTDYGLSENQEEFNCLYKYSPLHNVKKANYPATLVLTGDHDDRVVPGHSYKFIATLQENNAGKNPTLIRVDVNTGHGSGKPTTKQIAEFADMWSFVFYHLGMSY